MNATHPLLHFLKTFPMVSFCRQYFSEIWGRKGNMTWQLGRPGTERQMIHLRDGIFSKTKTNQDVRLTCLCEFAEHIAQRWHNLTHQVTWRVWLPVSVMISPVILTASFRPDSVGELSMRASNTSSALVLTYRRTSVRRETKGSMRWRRLPGWYLMNVIRVWVLHLPLCGSSLRACLLGGEQVWLSLYCLFWGFLYQQRQ